MTQGTDLYYSPKKINGTGANSENIGGQDPLEIDISINNLSYGPPGLDRAIRVILVLMLGTFYTPQRRDLVSGGTGR